MTKGSIHLANLALVGEELRACRPLVRESAFTETAIRKSAIEQDVDAISAALAALAQGTRLSVFRLLVQAGPDGLPAGRIGELLDIPATTLSFHLSRLARVGLVNQLRDGRSIIYSANFKIMLGLIDFLSVQCCVEKDDGL